VRIRVEEIYVVFTYIGLLALLIVVFINFIFSDFINEDIDLKKSVHAI